MAKNYVSIRTMVPHKRSFAYVDTKKKLADGIFIKHRLYVSFGKEFEKPGEKYKVIFCHIDKKRVSDFEVCMKELKNKMLIMGNTDYEDFCGSIKGMFGAG